MAGGIFVSYRRDDTRQAAGRLADDLADHFGSPHIFRDIEGIDPGVEFAQALNQALETCAVMLVLIGPKWLDICDAQGRRRLDNPNDWIRQEIGTALRRGIRVVPVLIDGAALPDEASLSDELKPLVRRQALELADTRWRGDLQRLVDTLAKLPGLQRQPAGQDSEPPKSRKKLWIGIVVGVLVLIELASYAPKSPDAEAPGNASSAGNADADVPSVPATPTPVSTSVPTPAPAAPQVQQQVVPVQAAQPVAATPSVPDIAGLWRTLSGETYQFAQQGTQLRFTAHVGGQPAGTGEGQLDGALLRLSMTLAPNGVPMGVVNCNLQASPDFSRFVGLCQGVNGQFPAQMFR